MATLKPDEIARQRDASAAAALAAERCRANGWTSKARYFDTLAAGHAAVAARAEAGTL